MAEKKPDEIRTFVDDHFENQLKHCDIRRMRFKLETNGAIKTYQRQQLDRCGTQAEANSEFREILLQDATSETLLAVAGTLETAPDTSNMNKKFAKAIRQFLRSEGTTTVRLESSRENTDSNPTTNIKVKFVLLTANDMEFKTVRHFFKENDEDYSYYKEPTLKGKTKFTEDYKDNPKSSFDYDLIEIGDVQGIHMKCSYQYGGQGADDAVDKILKEAKMKEWPLEMIFCVGCCGCSSDEICRGYVLISDTLVDISGGKLVKGEFIAKEVAREMNHQWSQRVLNCEEKADSPVIKVKRAKCILSGGLLIKDEKAAKKLRRDRELVGIEMEGWGIAHNLHQKNKCDLPGTLTKKDFLIVKGVSDHAGSDKSTHQSTLFLGKQTGPVDDDKRQEIATLQSTALVCRAIATHM